MKRKLAGILILVLLCSLFPVQALAAETAPTYYLFNGKSLALLDTKNFAEAVWLCDGYTLVADGGSVTLSKGLDVINCSLILNNTNITLKKGTYSFEYYPTLLGNATLSIVSGVKYLGAFENKWYYHVGPNSDYLYFLKSGKIIFSNTSGKGNIDLTQTNEALQLLNTLKRLPPETITIDGTVNTTDYSVYSGDTVIVKKGATLNVTGEFYLPGAKLINYGTINIDGVLGVSDRIIFDSSMPDFNQYDASSNSDMKRYYAALSRYLNRIAGTSTGGCKFDNYGTVRGSGLLVVLKDGAVTNYGSIACNEIYNTGKVVNSNGSMDTVVLGSPVTSAKNTSMRIVAFYLTDDVMSYTKTVQAGKAFGKAQDKNLQLVLEVLAPWYLDKKYTLPFNYQTTIIEEDISLYSQRI